MQEGKSRLVSGFVIKKNCSKREKGKRIKEGVGASITKKSGMPEEKQKKGVKKQVLILLTPRNSARHMIESSSASSASQGSPWF